MRLPGPGLPFPEAVRSAHFFDVFPGAVCADPGDYSADDMLHVTTEVSS